MCRKLYYIIYSILLCLPLTACSDVRNRLSPDVLAVTQHSDGTAQFAMRCSQNTGVITADAASPLMLCSALRAASGKEIDAGHISLLLLSGNPAALIPDYLRMQVLMPTGEVVFCPDDPCTLRDIPDTAQLRAAVDAGLLPARTADLFLGDLQNGSGVSALPCFTSGQLSLTLCDAGGICGTLSEDACRGLALLGRRWEQFSFAADGCTVSVSRTHLDIQAAEIDGQLLFTLTGTAVCRPEGAPASDWIPAAETALRTMLLAAAEETAQNAGADLLLLREISVRDGIAGTAHCSKEDWRSRLQSADFAVQISVHSAEFG